MSLNFISSGESRSSVCEPLKSKIPNEFYLIFTILPTKERGGVIFF